MADALALYRAVMGEVWDDDQRRVGAARDSGAARQGRGRGRRPVPGRSRGWTGGHGAPWGRPSARDLMRAAAGGRAAVFKRIRAGGCKSPRALRDQLSYVNDKAVFVTSTLIPEPKDGTALGPAEKMEIVDAFTDRWAGTTKLSHTSHMLLSFPEGVEVGVVRDVAVEWAERLFESGHYGDTWDYVLAVHDDRDHKHAHVMLNNRGRDHGTWFSCWREGVMSPQHMREVMAEIAGEHGVMLEATSRLERGLVTEPAPMEEVYAARQERRPRREVEPDVVRETEARAAHARFAEEQRDLADVLDLQDEGVLAPAVRAMAESVGNGTGWEATMARMEGSISASDIRTAGDAMDWARGQWRELNETIRDLEPEDRTRVEIETAKIKTSLASLMPDDRAAQEWTQTLDEAYPPGADVDAGSIAIRRDGPEWTRAEGIERVLEEGRRLGIDADQFADRIEAGGTDNRQLASHWENEAIAGILRHHGVDWETAYVSETDHARDRLNTFLGDLREAVQEEAMTLAGRSTERETSLEKPGDEAEIIDLTERLAARGAGRDAEPAPAPPPEVGETQAQDRRAREAAEQAAYLADHSELLSSPDEVYAMHEDGTATLRENGQAPRVMRELSEMGLTGLEADAEARIAEALSERHPDMPDHVARDVAITYANTAELVERQGGVELEQRRGDLGREAEEDAGADPSLQALATRMRTEDIPDEEKAQVAAALEETLRRRLGAEEMARLDDGDHSALEVVLPGEGDRMTVAHERLEMKRELSRERGLESDMDDDMGL